ncbi:hypothetical protein CMEL01_07076 [Colletotrichum melonis]|uniref:Uncharacterized protein n=1 Tax=Colletotrichum melonis TaxID=1209925 RepID=A0AAI9U3Q4_9PEZI|nr:hypothetical protein CMEL01_07076 [Colletotrichum melonis]
MSSPRAIRSIKRQSTHTSTPAHVWQSPFQVHHRPHSQPFSPHRHPSSLTVCIFGHPTSGPLRYDQGRPCQNLRTRTCSTLPQEGRGAAPVLEQELDHFQVQTISS